MLDRVVELLKAHGVFSFEINGTDPALDQLYQLADQIVVTEHQLQERLEEALWVVTDALAHIQTPHGVNSAGVMQGKGVAADAVEIKLGTLRNLLDVQCSVYRTTHRAAA